MATKKALRASRTTRTSARTNPRVRSARKSVPSRAGAAAPSFENRRQGPETLRLRSVEPSLTVNDIERSIRFYTDVLGFIVGERWSDKGVLRGVRLKAGVCEISLSQDDWAKGRDRKKGEGLRIWCKTAQEIDARAAQIKAAGGRLSEEPTDHPWGTRSMSIDDPDGYHITIYRER